MKIALITGANGFLGSHLARYMSGRGWQVRALVRNPDQNGFFFDLSGKFDDRAFSVLPGDEVVVIHCAHSFTNSAANCDGTSKLLERTRAINGARFVFISSMAAHDGAVSNYGTTKLKIEGTLDQKRDLIIKPGTIVGAGGLFGRLRDVVKNVPAIPVFYRSKQVQTVAIDDLCKVIASLVERRAVGTFAVAHHQPVSVSEFYRLLLKQLRINKPLIPFSGDLVLPFLRGVEKLGVHLPVTSENLLGLKHSHYFDVSRQTEINLKNYEESLAAL